jgi:hypothetical protein
MRLLLPKLLNFTSDKLTKKLQGRKPKPLIVFASFRNKNFINFLATVLRWTTTFVIKANVIETCKSV